MAGLGRARYRERMFTPSVLLASLFFSCIAHENPVRRDARESVLLTESATLYWEAIRWGDADRAGKFIERSVDRTAFQDWLEDKTESERLVEAKIVGVVLGEAPAEDDKAAPPREGTVSVRTEGYKVPEQIVHNETIEQTWYRLGNGWYVRWP